MLNSTVLHGRLTADPELKHTPNDIPVTSFSLAVNTGYGDNQRVAYIDCVAWRKTAEFLTKYFAKGQELALVGSLQTRTYETRDGSKRKVTEVVAQSIDFCGAKPKKAADSPEPVCPPLTDDDLPF